MGEIAVRAVLVASLLCKARNVNEVSWRSWLALGVDRMVAWRHCVELAW